MHSSKQMPGCRPGGSSVSSLGVAQLVTPRKRQIIIRLATVFPTLVTNMSPCSHISFLYILKRQRWGNPSPVACQICNAGFEGFCVLYTVASFLSWLLCQLLQQRQRIASIILPAIKPLDHKNEDLLLRKALTAVHWQLMANKAAALSCIKTVPPTSTVGNASKSFSVRPRAILSKKNLSLC